MSTRFPMLGMFIEPGVLITLIPAGVVLLGFVTFEIAIAITVSTLPRSRFQQKWTPQEQRRIIRVFCTVFCIWPITAVLIVAHVYLSLMTALIVDAFVLLAIVLAVRWLIHGVRQRKLIQAGHCVNCFYDLRASKESDHCPECGVELHDHPVRATRKRSMHVPSAKP